MPRAAHSGARTSTGTGNTPPEALAIDATSDVAGIPSAAPPKIAGREWEAKRRFEVWHCCDWRGYTPQQRAARDEFDRSR